MTTLEVNITERGFRRADFIDRYDAKCSIQESSLATEAAIWLGMNEGAHHQGECLARMHLTQEQVATLLPLLQCFVETGYLPSGEGKEE